MQQLSIFEYQSARRFLLERVQYLRKNSSQFSIRKWAKSMGMTNHALLVLLLQGKRNLTQTQVPYFAKGLNLTTPERMYFQMLIQLDQARGDEEKALVRSWLRDLNPGVSYHAKEIDHYLVISHWIHMAILAKTFSKFSLVNVEQIITSFSSQVSTLEIYAAFERLKELGLLEWNENQGRFIAKYSRTTTKDDVTNHGVREYHKQVSQLAINAIEAQEPLIREFQSFAINVPTHQIPVLKEMIRKFRTQVEQVLSHETNSDDDRYLSDDVYQMNLQFFRLSDQPCATMPKVQTDIGASKNPNFDELVSKNNTKYCET